MSLKRVRKRLVRTPRTKLAELVEGSVGRVVGRTRPLDAYGVLEAPLSGRPCVYFDVRIEAPASFWSWRVISAQRAGVPFVIQDGSARAVIEPIIEPPVSGVDPVLDIVEETVTKAHPHPSTREFRFMQSRQIPYASGYLRFRESIIGFDELIAVLGAGVREADPLAPPPSDYRSEPPTRLRFATSRENRLVISTASQVVLAP